MKILPRKRLRLMPLCFLLCATALFAQTTPDIGRYTSGKLPTSRINAPGVAGLCLQTDGNGGVALIACASGGGGGGYATIQNAAAAITQRAIINWVDNITCSDNSGATRSDCNFKSTISTAIMNATTGFQVNGAAGAGKVLIGDGTNFVPGDPLVQGLFADGSTSVDNPVTIGGYDTAGTPARHRATFINGTPAGTEYGIVSRNIPSGTQTVSGSVSVSNFPATQAISAASLPLPSGAAQEHTGAASFNASRLTDGTTFYKGTTPADTQPISASSLPLPTGAALESGGNLATVAAAVRAEDTASADADKGIGALAIRKATPANTSTTDGDYEYLQMSNGRLWTSSTIDSALPAGSNIIGSAKLTDGTNTQAVKAASTAAAATDPSSVTQLSPNQPQLTTPLNVRGAKATNNAAPDATELGTLPAVANAAPQSLTEGNNVKLRTDLKGNLLVNNHPPDVLGCYQVNMRTSTYAGLAAATPLLSIRWGDATHLMVINHLRVNVITTVAATTAGQAEREVIIARGFTASDTGGTAITLTGNNQKMRTSQATSLVTDMRVGTTITAGTRTLDANPIASAIAWLPLNMTGVDIGCNGAGATAAAWSCVSSSGFIDLVNAGNGTDYPIVLAQNEGVIGRIGKDAMPAGATQQTYWQVGWCEVNAY